jgi:hypothetical protein
MIELHIDLDGVVLDLDAIEADVMDKLTAIAEMVGVETVAFLRSHTAEMRPPARRGGPRRPAHPGHWADVTGQLANGYEWEVRRGANEVTLILKNGVEYAVWLEMHEGYFVLGPVVDPGGPAEQALRRAADRIAPDWEVR